MGVLVKLYMCCNYTVMLTISKIFIIYHNTHVPCCQRHVKIFH